MAAWPWVVSRAAVLAALGLAHVLVAHTHPDAATVFRVRQGLLGWDAGWYQAIAAHGYRGAGYQSLRFWPLLPLLARAVAVLPGVSVGVGLLGVANVSELVGLALLGWLVATETGDADLGRRTVWLAALAPPAFVTVMGYAEATLLVCSVAALAAARRRRWGWAALAGLAAGMVRPLGVALVAAIAVEAFRPWWEVRLGRGGWRRRRSGTAGAGGGGATVIDRGAGSPRLLGRVAAVVAPAVGFGSLLVWAAVRDGNGLAPIEIQQRRSMHGHLADPITTIAHDALGLFDGRHLGEGLQVPWVALAVVLLVVVARRLPASYTVLSVAIVAAALSGTNLESFDRYALSAFPLAVAGALGTRSARVERLVLCLATAGLVGFALLAFTNVLVP